MTSIFEKYKYPLWVLISIMLTHSSFSQSDTSTFKAQFALGINSPNPNGFVNGFEAKSINFPTINLGLQYMFKSPFGAKLDFGYNRFSNLGNTPEFKVNYSRLNAQLVYDIRRITTFLPSQMTAFVHAGPGFSMIKPLGDYIQNDTSFLNGLSFVGKKLLMYLNIPIGDTENP